MLLFILGRFSNTNHEHSLVLSSIDWTSDDRSDSQTVLASDPSQQKCRAELPVQSRLRLPEGNLDFSQKHSLHDSDFYYWYVN